MNINRYYRLWKVALYGPKRVAPYVRNSQRKKGCTLCVHPTKIIYSNNQKADKVAHLFNNSESTVFKGMDMIAGQINGWTASLLLRSDIAKNMPEWYKSIQYGDVALKMICAAQGSIGYIGGSYMSVYRRGTEGAWSEDEGKSLEWEKKRLKNHLQLINYFDEYTNHRFNESLKLKKSKHIIIYLNAVQPYCSKFEGFKLICNNLDLIYYKPKKFFWSSVMLIFGGKSHKYLLELRNKIRKKN